MSLPPSIPLQQLVDRHLEKAAVAHQPDLAVNYLSTQIAMADRSHHSFVWTPRLPQPKTCDQPVDQSCSAPRLLANPTRSQEAFSSGGELICP